MLKDKVVIVTGAGSGIGRGAAQVFAAAGARVMAVDVNEASARETAEEIRAAGGQAQDVAQLARVRRRRAQRAGRGRTAPRQELQHGGMELADGQGDAKFRLGRQDGVQDKPRSAAVRPGWNFQAIGVLSVL